MTAPNTIVKWRSHSMGQYKTHTGRVIAFVPGGTILDIPDEFLHIPYDRARIAAISKNDRYLVVVNEGQGYAERLYAPIKFTVDGTR